jgi:hypothetical protein
LKQHITHLQFDELTPEQRQKWLTWTFAKDKEIEQDRVRLETMVSYIGQPSYRSIGHLIWFLNDYMSQQDGWWAMNRSRYPNVWSVETKYDVGIMRDDGEGPELIDVLWEAVKVVLSVNSNETGDPS